MSSNAVLSESYEVRPRLEELGLNEKVLKQVVERGAFAFRSCSTDYPPGSPGYVDWCTQVAGLREILRPLGFTKCDKNNFSRVISADGKTAIAILRGDEDTGIVGEFPRNRNPKGDQTNAVIVKNQMCFNLKYIEKPASERQTEDEEIQTWFLITFVSRDEVRAELSLPSLFLDGDIAKWEERIILNVSPDDLITEDTPQQNDIDVVVKKRK